VKLLSVVSHGNGSGKTRLLTSILEAHPGRFAAVKFTTVFRDGQFCPKDAQRQCACTQLHDTFNVITDEATIATPDTDTGRLHAAGGAPVIWCLSREGHHADGWDHVREFLRPEAEVLTEGNTAMLTLPSDGMIFVANPAAPRKSWKDNWKPLVEKADAIVLNESEVALGRRRPAGPEEREASLNEILEAASGTPRVVAQLESPFGEWAGPLLESLVHGLRSDDDS
jgi:hypothetical protein